jgi:phenylacetate-CoA ligase
MADYNKAVAFFANTPAEVWEAIQTKTAMSVFRETAQNIDSYKEFLKLKKVKPEEISSFDDFLKIPLSDKYNYVQEYGFNEVNSVKPGKNLYSFNLSSGTIDEPTIWPRYYQYEEFLPLVFDLFMRQYWQIDKKSTLLVNAFAMGPWMAGFSVHSAIRPLTQKYNLTLATNGADIDSIVYAVVKLGKYYDQVIVFSYPTFARTIIDRLEDAGVNLKKIHLKMFIAGEGHTVEWRQYVNKISCGDANDLTTIVDGYGITDTGLSGMGTALTNLIRDLAFKDKELAEELFGKSDSVPSLFQYNSGTYYIEDYNGEIVITTKSTTPLVRYNVHDVGGVIKFREMEEILKARNYDYRALIKKRGLSQDIVSQQPFVYCFGRRDDTVIIGGANIFPEQIAPALFNAKVRDIHSFKLTTDSDEKQHQLFYVLLELRIGVTYNRKQIVKLEKKYKNIILRQLKNVNFDFADAYRVDPKVASPIVKIFRSGAGPFVQDKSRTKPRLVLKKKA